MKPVLEKLIVFLFSKSSFAILLRQLLTLFYFMLEYFIVALVWFGLEITCVGCSMNIWSILNFWLAHEKKISFYVTFNFIRVVSICLKHIWRKARSSSFLWYKKSNIRSWIWWSEVLLTGFFYMMMCILFAKGGFNDKLISITYEL